MKILKIRVDTIDKVKEFVAIASRFEEDLDVVRDKYVVDAKSIMGMFSMDLSKTIELHIHSDRKDILDAFDKFVVK